LGLAAHTLSPAKSLASIPIPQGPREWDARAYDSLALPHDRWGESTLARLRLNGVERVVDFGCGTGRDTIRLLARVHSGRVIAVDGSEHMLAALRDRLGSDVDRVEIIRTDLNHPLPLSAPVDAIFSVATLHWLPDHSSVFTHMAVALRPGGQLVAECGGQGNIASVSAAIASVMGGEAPADVWNFAGPEETYRRLKHAGFTDIEVDLVPDIVTFHDDQLIAKYLETVVLGTHLRSISSSDRAQFVRAVAARMPGREIDYVRLRIQAHRRTEPV
jgi:trans-aconitate 2-methyltransferase